MKTIRYMTFKEILLAFDLERDSLSNLYEKYSKDKNFIETLFNTLSDNQEAAHVVSWILKRYTEDGGELSSSQVNQLTTFFASDRDWQSELMFLQTLPNIELTDNDYDNVDKLVKRSINAENKFVKAWAYQGMYELVKLNPELVAELEFYCDKALRNEEGAVAARVRKIKRDIELSKKINKS